ncbi:hypothetical protein FQA39_LY17092 [Lamprigera yunnana]|nr:hypothetical protein FQA39_LY17092 [Lamprigera yunnana]
MVAKCVVVLDRGNNTLCTVNLHGATIVSWRVENQEQLFVSKEAVFDGRKPICGGISFVFPQFGPWTFGPSHGFARIVRWSVEKAPECLPGGDIQAILSITDNDFTRSMWNYPFKLTYHLILREKELQCNIVVSNPNKYSPFSFNILLGTHFKVPDVRCCQIMGLNGCTFIDKTLENKVCEEERDVVTIGEWTDRIYQNTSLEHIITNVVSGRTMRIQKCKFPDTVVWNPWINHVKDMVDFGDDEYTKMVCVEAGHVSSPVILLPFMKTIRLTPVIFLDSSLIKMSTKINSELADLNSNKSLPINLLIGAVLFWNLLCGSTIQKNSQELHFPRIHFGYIAGGKLNKIDAISSEVSVEYDFTSIDLENPIFLLNIHSHFWIFLQPLTILFGYKCAYRPTTTSELKFTCA